MANLRQYLYFSPLTKSLFCAIIDGLGIPKNRGKARRVHDRLIVAYAGKPVQLFKTTRSPQRVLEHFVKQLMTGVGFVASAALIAWILYQCELMVIDHFIAALEKDCDAKQVAAHDTLKDQASRDEAAIEAAAYLINRSVASGKLTSKKLLVCVYGTAPSGSLKYEPEMGSDYHACGNDQYSVTFPVTYDAFGKATVGIPTVTR